MSTPYLALLRAVNVGGRSMSMEELRRLASDLGHTDVLTYIQSGNLLFASENGDEEQVRGVLERAITSRFGMEVTVILRTLPEMETVLKSNPFVDDPRIDIKRLHVTFLAETPRQPTGESGSEGPDRYFVRGREIYLHTPEGYGVSKLNNSFFEKRLSVRATTRNWNSTGKLTDLLRARP